jgi:hypothetical protein
LQATELVADADFAFPEVNALLNLASIKESLAGYADEYANLYG